MDRSEDNETAQNDRGAGGSSTRSDICCWSCHRVNPTLFCTFCVRSYHETQTCCGSKKVPEDEIRSWKCPACIAIEKDEELMRAKQFDAKYVNKLLSLIFGNVKSDEYLSESLMYINYSKVNHKIANQMDLYKVERNIDNLHYRCFEAFLSDIKWIVHNVKVYHRTIFADNEDALKVTKWLLDLTKEEIYSIRMCDECYVNLVQHHRFDLVCKDPHLVVWAKQKTYPYWPAKLMSVDAAANTAEVRYFGEKHYRAVITPKDCYLYSTERPSIWLGAMKQQFPVAQEEASSYIKIVTEIYGSYKLAAAMTPLNANMLERHLYDTIPKAWTALGKHSIPPPIPKPFATSATIARRHSIASRPPQPKPSNSPNPISCGRIVTRRISTRLSEMKQNDVQPTKKVITRRQSIQVDMMSPMKRNLSIDSAAINTGLRNEPKKRKIQDDRNQIEQINSKSVVPSNGNISLSSSNSAKRTASKLDDDSVFKKPEIPRKFRKMHKTAALSPPTIDPAIIENVRVINEKILHGKPGTSSTDQCSTATITSAAGVLSTKAKSGLAKAVHLTEMGALFNAVIEKNTPKVNDCIRTSLEEMLHEFWDVAKPTQQLQKLQEQLANMRTVYNGKIDALKHENSSLKEELSTVTGKLDAQLMKVKETLRENAELNDILSATKSKMSVVSQDLRKCTLNNARLTSNLNQISKQNGAWQSMIVKLKTAHGMTLKQLKDVESKMLALNETNKKLTEKNADSSASLQRAKKEHQNMLNQLKDLETKCNVEKTKAYDHCYRMINENKKKQWCTVCQKEGGRFYCSRECEEYHWSQNRQDKDA